MYKHPDEYLLMDRKVLVIEDSKAIAAVVQAELSDYEVVLAASYQEAEQALNDHQGRFFVAIVDLNLPDAAEGEAIDLVVAAGIPAIANTALVNKSLRENILGRGIADYVQKRGRHSVKYLRYMVDRICKNPTNKILVIDPRKATRLNMCHMLKLQSYQVFEAVDAASAMLLLASEDVSMVMIDADLGNADGVDLTSKIRDLYPKEDLAIIGIASADHPGTATRFIKSGANDFLVKPCQREEFLCRVNQNVDIIEQFRDLKKAEQQRHLFMAMAAHDIRSPLAVINSTCKILPRKEAISERGLTLVNMMEQSSTALLHLLEELLDFASSEGELQLNLCEASLSDLILERIKLITPTAEEKQIMIKSSLDTGLNVQFDRNRIQQVIDNFISNAIKFSPPNTTVNICLKQERNSARVDIIDEGPGIRESERDKLFGTFSKLSSRPTAGEHSSGLGLAICKKMIEAHRGDVGYQPGIEKGSDFYFRLPCSLRNSHLAATGS